MTDYTQFAGKLFDAAVFQSMLHLFTTEVVVPTNNPPLLTNDPEVINEFIGRLHYFYAVAGINTGNAIDRKPQAERLIKLLQSKYDLN